jgi:hypothetical protein
MAHLLSPMAPTALLGASSSVTEIQTHAGYDLWKEVTMQWNVSQ